MTILLHDYIELEERVSRHLRIWKVWHVILYVLTAVFGVLNYVFLQNTLALVDGNCLLYPRNLVFHMVEKPQLQDYLPTVMEVKNITNEIKDQDVINTTGERKTSNFTEPSSEITISKNRAQEVDEKSQKSQVKETGKVEENIGGRSKKSIEDDNIRKTPDEKANDTNEKFRVLKEKITRNTTEGIAKLNNTIKNEIAVVVNNATIVIENATHHLMLDTTRTFFGRESDCQFAEYMPILCTIFAVVWTTLFIMCPGGGRSRSGLQQPWRILMPALLFAVVMVGLTGHSFSLTNGGLQDFCSSFHNLTNNTACSSVDRFVEKAWNSSWGVGVGVGMARAGSAGVWALWACGAAVLLARILVAPDFIVRRTGAYLARDPLQKITPHLQKTSRGGKRSVPNSPRRRDNSSVKSEPTVTTELVTASVEHAQESTPTSLTVTPLKQDKRETMMELADSPAGLFNDNR